MFTATVYYTSDYDGIGRTGQHKGKLMECTYEVEADVLGSEQVKNLFLEDFPACTIVDIVLNGEDDVECDDSDDGYALASAGWGTDEDYGCSAEEML